MNNGPDRMASQTYGGRPTELFHRLMAIAKREWEGVRGEHREVIRELHDFWNDRGGPPPGSPA